MNVQISKKAELFYKAFEDIWAAEQIWRGSPNNAVWHCTQAIEKIMKGFLRCVDKDYDYGHELKYLLDIVRPLCDLSSETINSIIYFDDFGVSLRYKNMSSDPSTDEARLAIARSKKIFQNFQIQPIASGFISEANEVFLKVLKYSDEDDS